MRLVPLSACSLSKPQIPVTNLKERIAALEQQRNAGKPSRATSPSPGLGGSAGGPSVGALRDKIAKFEKKGGVPVPRGTFGLGAPPPPEARVQKKGELYGNRIPQPVRMVSANHTGNSGGVTSHSTGGGMGTGIGMGQPPSRSSSSMGFNYDRDYRRSVSMSSVITDLDDRPDYTPLTSPTFNFPDSPGSTVYTPEGSPSPLGSPDGSAAANANATIQTVMTAAARPPVMPRSTSFAEAVERAKKVAEAKGGVVGEKVQEGSAPTPFIAAAVKDQFEPNGQPKSLVEGGGEKEGRSLTEEPTAIDDTTPATGAAPVPVVVENDEPPTPTAAASPVDSTESQSPISPPSSAPVEPDTPTAVVSPISELLQELAPNSEVQAPPAGETKKPASRNNKDLSLDVEALKIQSATGAPANDASKPAVADDTTPTTATYSNLLSPPQTGNSVLSSGSSVSPRPYSMVELSWAERVTPATSRGNVMFLPPSSTQLPRKTDLINYPPTPTEADSKPQDGGNKKANGSATTRTAASSKPTTFTAVVHKKIREAEVALPAGPHELPQTPRKQKRMTMMPFQSPGNPELLSLLQNAVMLESTLEHGELPTEVAKKKEEEEKERERERQAQELAAALAADKARAELEEQKRLAFEDQKAKEEEEEEDEAARKAKLRHTFLIPLSKARYQHKKEMSVASARAAGVEVELDETGLPELPERLPSPGGKEEEEEKPRMSIHHNLPPPPPHIPPQPQPQPQTPQADSLAPVPKSAGSKSRFSTFRRLGSVKSMIGGPGAASRKSIASDFSDDTTYSSIPAVITPDGSVAHGDVDDFGMTSVNHSQEQSWPSLSPKKSGGGSRTSTFGKMFSRSRTKSSGSTLSNASDSASSKAPSVYTLPPLPDTLSAIPSGPEYENRQPRRSISMKSLKSALKGRSSIDSTNAPPLPRTRTVDAQPPPPVLESNGSTSPTSTLGSPGPLKSPDYLGYNPLNPPMDTGNGGRPTSLVSVASTLPSPLFDKDIFDAFPAVPSGTPASASQYDQGQGMPSAALLTPSFDSVFLGSAIHLAGSHKSTIGTPTTATGGMYSPLPPASAATVDGSAGSSRQRRA
ncbi:hypothetical protein CC1G_13830 [Coprinopsis cinerea okayama7|uniref:Uncharacterized protein n=1 Tax=Coprinopsis cinerea (strain Okayama-7 / 130 / ATCC MYA-4618 / FGSC 9003) TaxID=240176 RepID=D6RKJ2_COPC7|nr:hypothetical protein CC1G_13830 [Coprinopsis cinerea okayama7\|eukprot:XP_002911795.1 hypothetical protein CC1G_13830 [Coprinopsis cinerea okayama7\